METVNYGRNKFYDTGPRKLIVREQTCSARALLELVIYMGLTSPYGKKCECFKRTGNNIFISTVEI
jgi:hypothetical protein